MWIRRPFVVVVCAIVLATGVALAGESDTELMAEVTAFGDTLTKAMLDNDVDLMLSMYADDAISLPNYGPRMEGIETFKKHHEEMAASGMEIKSFVSHPTEVWETGDQITEIGRFEIEISPPGMPNTIKDHGSYVTIYERGSDGSLKIKVETWNTDMTPQEIGMGASPGGHGDEDE